VVLDTETTGIEHALGHRVIEIYAARLLHGEPTGEEFYALLDPEMPIPPQSTAVHGRSDADVAGCPRFADVAVGFLDFVGDSRLVAHNAAFDIGFLNAELARLGFPPLANEALDTLSWARRMFPPGSPADLDSLARRYGVDTSGRSRAHDARVDVGVLAEVLWHMRGGARDLGLADPAGTGPAAPGRSSAPPPEPVPDRGLGAATAAEAAAHASFLASVKDPIWTRR